MYGSALRKILEIFCKKIDEKEVILYVCAYPFVYFMLHVSIANRLTDFIFPFFSEAVAELPKAYLSANVGHKLLSAMNFVTSR